MWEPTVSLFLFIFKFFFFTFTINDDKIFFPHLTQLPNSLFDLTAKHNRPITHNFKSFTFAFYYSLTKTISFFPFQLIRWNILEMTLRCRPQRHLVFSHQSFWYLFSFFTHLFIFFLLQLKRWNILDMILSCLPQRHQVFYYQFFWYYKLNKFNLKIK